MILIFSILGIVNARVPCDPGSYAVSMDTCASCPQGWFQNMEDALTCMECTNINQYSDVPGALSCKTCPAGTVRANNQGCSSCSGDLVRDSSSSVCFACPSGFTRKDSTMCIECPIAATQLTPCCSGSVVVNGKCSECPIGTYIQSPTDSSCTTCPIGKTSNLGENECSTCPTGMGTNETTKTCFTCPPGTYSNGGSCLECPENTHQTEHGQIECEHCHGQWVHDSPITPCKYNHSCPLGHSGEYCDACPVGRVRSKFQENCTACPGHSIQDGNLCVKCPTGQVSENNVCIYCSEGKFRVSSETCKDCAPGQFGTTAGACESCAIGKYQDQAGATTCKNCPPGRFRTASGGAWCSTCPSNSGSTPGLDDCEVCSAGRASSNGECKDCSAGFYRPSTSFMTSCVFCPEGWIASDAGLGVGLSCSICDIGKYSNYNRTLCATCQGGNVTNVHGLGAYGCASTHMSCGAGRYGDAFECKTCPSGWSSGTHQQTCDECQQGTFAVSGSAFCQVCANGKYSFEGASCKDCPSGRSSDRGVCKDCPRGKYQPQSGQPTCIQCPSAETTVGSGETSAGACQACESDTQVISSSGLCTWCDQHEYPKQGVCTHCPRGWENILRASACTKCAPGFASLDGVCEACAPGFTAPAEGQSECTNCADLSGSCTGCSPGFYLTTSGCKECSVGLWSAAGETECSRCQRGTYQNKNGQNTCEHCPPGKYMNELGAAACTLCPSGFFQIHGQSAVCHECSIGRYSREGLHTLCETCPPGKSTTDIKATGVQDCQECPPGSYEHENVCTLCPESSYQDEPGTTTCKPCQGNSLSPKGSVSVDSCFPVDDLKTYVFGLKGDTKQGKAFTSECELRPNSVLLCPGCTCDDDARNGYWSGPICDECRRGFATSKCTSMCPGYDGTNDESMCSGNGKCWYGMHGTGLCYCGGDKVLDPSSAGVVVDVRTCPKGKICAGYGISVQSRTTYKPLYYLLQYRQFSAFVLQMNKYTPARGHMWFKRFPPSVAYENKCSMCVGPRRGTFSTDVGFWNRDGDYSLFPSSSQTPNGFHGENCQHECGMCLHGGVCNNVPHPYRRTYTIEDTFLPQRTISIPTTTCLCTSILYDSNHMCCPNGFQPYLFVGNRHTVPYSRFTNLPHVTSMRNEQHDWHIGTDLWLTKDSNEMRKRGETYRPPYYEPASGNMYASVGSDIIEVPYSTNGPYNQHVYYGTARDICRACPGLFGKGVSSRLIKLETESDAEQFWWDNAIGSLGRKCNGVGKCNFYTRDRETEVEFMGSVNDYRRVHRGRKCASTPIRTTLQESRELCIQAANGAAFVAFSESYRGGTDENMVQNVSGSGPWRTNERAVVLSNSAGQMGWAEEISSGAFTLVESQARPDTDSGYIIWPTNLGTCIYYASCESQTYAPEFSVFDVHVGHGGERLNGATFDRFDTCFTYQTSTSGARQFGLFQTIPYENGQDPFLGHLCPPGHFCTRTAQNIGYKEACPVGYYQPWEGRTRTISETHCSSLSAAVPPAGCAFNEATADPYDLVDSVCIRCKRSEWSAAGSSVCSECSVGRVKKLSGNHDVASIRMMNIPTHVIPNMNPWYYIEDEYGQEAIDCAMVPPGMIHIPNANSKMTYSVPSFIAAVSCPFGMTSTPGSYMYDEFTSIEVQKSFNVFADAIVPPYMTFEPVTDFTISPNRTCHCVEKLVVDSRSICNLYANKENLQFVRLEEGPDGCWTHYAAPGFVFYSKPKGIGLSSPGLTNICMDEKYRSNLMTQMIGQYCRYCPGNSMTGSESGLCTTCFANKLKVYLKEAILLIASTSYVPMVDCQTDCATLPTNSSEREEYLMPFNAWKFRNVELDTIPVTGSCTKDIILTPFAQSDVSMTLPQCLIACSMTEIYASADDEHPSGNKWTIVGVDSDQCICSKEIPQKGGDFWECEDDTHTQVMWRMKKFINETADTNWFSDGLPLCSTCSSGKFLSNINGACTPCPHGRYTSTSLEASSSSCLKCAIGHFAPNTGMKGCLKCAIGKAQIETAAVTCDDCPTGLYQDSPGGTTCKTCPLGFVSRVDFCESCPSGKHGNGSGTSLGCAACPLGYSQPQEGQHDCVGCSRGRYQDIEGSSSCVKCPMGKFGDSLRQTSDTCKDCLRGTFNANTGSTSCTRCADGHYQDEEGKDACTPCPGGTKCQTATLGGSCEVGKYAPASTHVADCFTCEDDGKHYTNIDASACNVCSSGSYILAPLSNNCQTCGNKGWLGINNEIMNPFDLRLRSTDKILRTLGDVTLIVTEALSRVEQHFKIRTCVEKGTPEYILLKKNDEDLAGHVDDCTEFDIYVSANSITSLSILFPTPLIGTTEISIKVIPSQPLYLNVPTTTSIFEDSIQLREAYTRRRQEIYENSEQIDRYRQGCMP